MSTTILITIIIIAVVVFWLITAFNSLVKKRNLVKNAWSDIDVQLKRRYDLIPNLVEAVKGYMAHEKNLLVQLTEARTAAMGVGSDLKARGQAENMLSGTLKTLFAVAENYPQLRASENFQQLQTQLSALENDIQSARRFYNATVREMNNATQTFPTNLIASLLGFGQMEFFQAEEGERAAVKVSI